MLSSVTTEAFTSVSKASQPNFWSHNYKVFKAEKYCIDDQIQYSHYAKETTSSARENDIPKSTQLTGGPEHRCLRTNPMFILSAP